MIRLALLALAVVAAFQGCAAPGAPLIVKRGCWTHQHCLVTAVYVPAENISALCRKDGAQKCVERGARVHFFGRGVRTVTYVGPLSPSRPAESYLTAAHEDCHAVAMGQDLEPLEADHPAVAALGLAVDESGKAYLCHREDKGTARADDDEPAEGAR